MKAAFLSFRDNDHGGTVLVFAGRLRLKAKWQRQHAKPDRHAQNEISAAVIMLLDARSCFRPAPILRNVPCQDAFRFRTFGSAAEWLVIATADGAGSASHSEIGATLACDEFVRRVEALEPDQEFTRDGMTALFTEVRR
jgi:hypothetical protein